MAKRKINAVDLVQQIEKLTKARMASGEVVSLEKFRDFKKKVDPQVILVIDDEEIIRNAIKRILEQDDYLVRLAADGTELSKVLEEVTPDLILMDVELPWLNGLELGQMLKEHKDLKKIPLVFISGKTSEEDIKKAFDVGADDYVKKPFEVDKLKKTVQTLLRLNKA